VSCTSLLISLPEKPSVYLAIYHLDCFYVMSRSKATAVDLVENLPNSISSIRSLAS
jgi:hypothetical protein